MLKNGGELQMKKLIMLTFFVSCVTILFVGCENGNIKINESVSEKTDFLGSGEELLKESRK